MSKARKILFIVLGIPAACILLLAGVVIYAVMGGSNPQVDYDDPESLWLLAERTERYLLLANPGKDSPARKEALQALEDIALLEVSEDEKARLIRERFPEESFWTDDMKALLKEAESGDAEAQFRLGGVYIKRWFWDTKDEHELAKCVIKSEVQAAKWFRKAALQGHAKAQSMLAKCYHTYEESHPLAKNLSSPLHSRKKRERIRRESEEWMLKSGQNGNSEAYLAAALMWCDIPLSKEEIKQELEALTAAQREAAEHGNIKAMLLLGMDFSLSSPDAAERVAWLKKASELDSVPGMCLYATVLEIIMKKPAEADAAGIPTDYRVDEETVKHWRQKAFDTAVKRLDEGDAEGMVELFGSGTRPHLSDLEDYLGREDLAAFVNRTVLKLWDRIEVGDYEFAPQIIDLFSRGFDQETVQKLVELELNKRTRRLAELGFCEYQQLLAMHELRGSPAEQAEAIRLFRKLAGFGMPDARGYLGDCYLNGLGVPKDKPEAVKWLRLAATQKYIPAADTLSECLRTGDPPTDRYEAWLWAGRTEAYRKYDSYLEYLGGEILELLQDIWRDITR